MRLLKANNTNSYDCNIWSVEELDLSCWNISYCTDVTYCFYDSDSLESVIFGDYDMPFVYECNSYPYIDFLTLPYLEYVDLGGITLRKQNGDDDPVLWYPFIFDMPLTIKCNEETKKILLDIEPEVIRVKDVNLKFVDN